MNPIRNADFDENISMFSQNGPFSVVQKKAHRLIGEIFHIIIIIVSKLRGKTSKESQERKKNKAKE